MGVAFWTGKWAPQVTWRLKSAYNKFLMEQHTSLLKVLNLMFTLIMSGDYNSTWSISRPLLGLILLHENDFIQMKDTFVQNLSNQHNSEEKKEKLKSFFDELMTGVENNLNTRNRDHFTRNLYTFALHVRDL
jgi:exportin-7